MAASPTAMTGALFCAPRLATNWPTPTATAPASRPARAPKSGRDLSVSDVMMVIRRSRARGLVARQTKPTTSAGSEWRIWA